MKDRSDDPSHHERTLLPRRNILPPRSKLENKYEVLYTKIIQVKVQISKANGGVKNITRGIVTACISEDLTNHTLAERKSSKRLEVLFEDKQFYRLSQKVIAYQ